MNRLTFLLLWLLAAATPCGNLLRFATMEDLTEGSLNRGITSLLAAALLGLGVLSGAMARGAVQYPRWLLLLCFMMLAALTSLWVDEPTANLRYAIELTAYMALAVTISGARLSDEQIATISGVYASSMAVVSVLTLLDFGGWVDLARVNATGNYIHVEGLRTGYINLTGPFFSRTVLAIYMAIALPVAYFRVLAAERRSARMWWTFALLAMLLVTALSAARGLWVATAAFIAYGQVFGAPTHRRRGTIVLIVCLCLAIPILLATTDTIRQALSQLALSMQPSAVADNESDMLRFEILMLTLRDMVSYPLGTGFTNPYVPSVRRALNPHSNVVLLARAAGLPGLIMLTLFLAPLLRRLIRPGHSTGEVMIYAVIISIFVYGLTHTSVFTAFNWIILGLAVALRQGYRYAPARSKAPGFPLTHPHAAAPST